MTEQEIQGWIHREPTTAPYNDNVGFIYPQQGWICPRCGKVNAPWMPQCTCNLDEQKENQTSNGGIDMFEVYYGEILFSIGKLEYWSWFLSVQTVENVGNRKHLFGNLFWRRN